MHTGSHAHKKQECVHALTRCACMFTSLPGDGETEYKIIELRQTDIQRAPLMTFFQFSGCPIIRCQEDYNPQCGQDGNTYDNLCYFAQRRCRDPDLLMAHAGECRPGRDFVIIGKGIFGLLACWQYRVYQKNYTFIKYFSSILDRNCTSKKLNQLQE